MSTEFVIKARAEADDLTIAQLNHKVNECIDWRRMREEGLFFEEPAYSVSDGPPTFTAIVTPDQTDRRVIVEGPGFGAMSMVEVYTADTGDVVFNGLTDKGLLNNGRFWCDVAESDRSLLVRVMGF